MVSHHMLGGEPWNYQETFPWRTRQGAQAGYVHRIAHSGVDEENQRGATKVAYFHCGIQVTERAHPRTSAQIPPCFNAVYARDQSGTLYGGFNLTKSKLKHDVGGEALLRYRLDDNNPLPCYYTEQEWSNANPLEWLATRPTRPNALAQGQPIENEIVED
ncbi:hypothetical protein AAVH_14722 [Aphelenchoides avenae]|nr:hypothetical protein AAVH_14722 [Aphelenchus avenae]